ncbi:hypothetical protein [Nostoc sp.]|uniref:hypothetical protein n=1 Tax=Nostoc sp. TaxID=1180 RepID=UPI002FFC806B
MITNAIVIGFDLTTRSWVTSASATSVFESLPSLDGVLYTDNMTVSPNFSLNETLNANACIFLAGILSLRGCLKSV